MSWYFEVLRKYAVFSGRARRKEYWFFALFNFLVSIALVMVEAALGMGDLESGYGPISGLYSLAVIIPGLAVSVRRLHDTGRSGWWFLVVLVPLIGAIVLLVFTLLDSEAGTNEYGPNPKELAF